MAERLIASIIILVIFAIVINISHAQSCDQWIYQEVTPFYIYNSNVTDPLNLNDSNWGTLSLMYTAPFNRGTAWVNYTYTDYYNSTSQWELMSRDGIRKNQTINDTCFKNPLEFRIWGQIPGIYTYCYNTTDWIEIERTTSGGEDVGFYEEGVWWCNQTSIPIPPFDINFTYPTNFNNSLNRSVYFNINITSSNELTSCYIDHSPTMNYSFAYVWLRNYTQYNLVGRGYECAHWYNNTDDHRDVTLNDSGWYRSVVFGYNITPIKNLSINEMSFEFIAGDDLNNGCPNNVSVLFFYNNSYNYNYNTDIKNNRQLRALELNSTTQFYSLPMSSVVDGQWYSVNVTSIIKDKITNFPEHDFFNIWTGFDNYFNETYCNLTFEFQAWMQNMSHFRVSAETDNLTMDNINTYDANEVMEWTYNDTFTYQVCCIDVYSQDNCTEVRTITFNSTTILPISVIGIGSEDINYVFIWILSFILCWYFFVIRFRMDFVASVFFLILSILGTTIIESYLIWLNIYITSIYMLYKGFQLIEYSIT